MPSLHGLPAALVVAGFPCSLDRKDAPMAIDGLFDLDEAMRVPTPVRSRYYRDTTTTATPLTGEAPSFHFVEDCLYVSHDCRAQRVSVLVNTHDWFGWQIVSSLPEAGPGFPAAVTLSHDVSCSAGGCGFRESTFEAEANHG